MAFLSFENIRIYIKTTLFSPFQSIFCKSFGFLTSFFQKIPKIVHQIIDIIKKSTKIILKAPEKIYILQKIPQNIQFRKLFGLKRAIFNEDLSIKLENLLYQKKINEFMELIKTISDLTEIKPSVFSLLFEILLELSNVTIAFEAMKILISSNFVHMNKKIIKNYFNICLKLRQSNLSVYLFQFFETSQQKPSDMNLSDVSCEISEIERNLVDSSDRFMRKCSLENINSITPSTKLIRNSSVENLNNVKNNITTKSMSLLSPISQDSKDYQKENSKENQARIEKNSSPNSIFFLMNHYFILNIQRLGEMDIAVKQMEQFLNNITCTNENTRIIHKIFEEIFKGCIINPHSSINFSYQLLEHIKLLSIKPNDIFFNKLIDFASKNDSMDLAELIFQNMLKLNVSPTIVTYNTLIYSYFKHNIQRKAWNLFEQLKVSNIKPDNFTYTTMINGIKNSQNFDLKVAFQLFNEYKQIHRPDQIIYNCLLDACINSSNFDKAREILAEIKKEIPENQCDEITYNTLIKGCGKSKQITEAIGFFEEMKAAKIKPNRITYNSLIDTCVKTNKMNIAWKFYDEMIRNEILPDNFTYSILINGIKSTNTNKEELLKTINLLEKLEKLGGQFQPDEILYNSLIDACVKFNEINKALCLFEEMKKKNIEPSAITYGILIKAFGKMNDLVKAFKIFEQIKLNNLKINDVTYGCLLDACVKNNRIDLALVLFEKIKQDNITLNTILYTTLIKGFSKANKLDEALEIFSIMKQNQKTYPNLITYNCILDACVKSKAFNKALSLFDEMKTIINPDLITYSTLIKGFTKMAEMKVSYDLFYSMMMEKKIMPDEPLINLMLEACFCNKNADMGIRIYETLEGMNVKFSNISYGIIIKV